MVCFYTCYAFIIHNNLSADAQNVTGAYVIIMLVNNARQLCDRLANNARKTTKLFVQGYNLEVHDIIKYRRVHAKTSCHCN